MPLTLVQTSGLILAFSFFLGKHISLMNKRSQQLDAIVFIYLFIITRPYTHTYALFQQHVFIMFDVHFYIIFYLSQCSIIEFITAFDVWQKKTCLFCVVTLLL